MAQLNRALPRAPNRHHMARRPGFSRRPLTLGATMALSMYQASIPVFLRGLLVLGALLKKGEDHAAAEGLDAAALLDGRLAPDMHNLIAQVQRASDTSKLSGQRLSGVPSPSMPDTETTFADLQARIAATIAYLEMIEAAQVDGGEDRTIDVKFGPESHTFRGDAYLLSFALPNFYFHVTTAYAILRNAGVPVGKRDFLGG